MDLSLVIHISEGIRNKEELLHTATHTSLVCLSIHVSVCLSHMSVCPSIGLSIHVNMCLSICMWSLCIFLPLCFLSVRSFIHLCQLTSTGACDHPCLFVCSLSCLFACLPAHPPVCLFVCPPVCPFVYMSVCLSTSVCLSIIMSVCLSCLTPFLSYMILPIPGSVDVLLL